MMQHNVKLGNKMFGGLENVIRTNTEILTLHYDLDLDAVMLLFFTRHSGLLWCTIRFSLVAEESTVQTDSRVIFSSYELLLWPWPWWQQTFFFFLHDTLANDAASTSISSLVTKCSEVQKISSRQIFTDILNLCCDLDLEHSDPHFSQDTLAYDGVLSNKVWLQTDQPFRRLDTVVFWLQGCFRI